VQTRTRLPVTLEVFRGLKQVWQRLPSQRNVSMLWAIATLCFYDFLRTGEVVMQTDTMYDQLRHLGY